MARTLFPPPRAASNFSMAGFVSAAASGTAVAVSAAELRHGPMALVKAGFPVLIFSQNDEARAGIEMLAMELTARHAAVLIAGSRCPQALPLAAEPADPAIEPMLLI